jgi:integrase/recombinase XerD
LLSVYGLRSGEVRRLRLDDIDWPRDRIRIVRSKSGHQEAAPLEPRVGNAIARYLCYSRPKTVSRVVFLTLRAPHRPLSAGGLYGVVGRHLSKNGLPKKGRGPHGLRHACARHLLESGRSFKEVGDHLGHRSPDATSYYAKVDLVSLRKVALDDFGGLI